MKIRTMTAIFGKLDRARLELGDGLNLICAPNEGGKSTWCAFWQAMLYGFDTRERDRKGHLAEKNRYQPWSGAPMAGELAGISPSAGAPKTAHPSPPSPPCTPGRRSRYPVSPPTPAGSCSPAWAGRCFSAPPSWAAGETCPSPPPQSWSGASPPWSPPARRTCPCTG